MEIRSMMLAVVLVHGVSPLAAGERCYVADQDSGRLEFAGLLERDAFSGQFHEFRVDYCMPSGDPGEGRLSVRVRTESADVRNRDGNEALRGEDFFDVGIWREANWESQRICTRDQGYRARGILVIRDVRGPQSIDFQLDPDGESWRMRGEAKILRLDFDVGLGEFADPEFIRNRVDLSFDLTLRPAD